MTSTPAELTVKPRVVVVAQGETVKSGQATIARDIVDDPVLGDEFDFQFVGVGQNDAARGKLALGNIKRVVDDAWATFRLARRGSVVHTHAGHDPWLVTARQVMIALAARARGARVVCHSHLAYPLMSPPGEWETSKLNAIMFWLLDRLSSAMILLSDAGVENMRKYMPTVDLVIVANSVVVDLMEKSTAVHDPPLVLFVGELLERKGILTLIDAAVQLREVGVEFDLAVVADSRVGLEAEKDRVIERINAAGYAESLTGGLAREQVYRLLSRADVLVAPTWVEAQSFTLIEALAAGVPIVASDIASISAMVTDGVNGHLVDKDDVDGFARAIGALLADPAKRQEISHDNIARATAQFDRSTFRASIAEVYRTYGTQPR